MTKPQQKKKKVNSKTQAKFSKSTIKLYNPSLAYGESKMGKKSL